MFPSTKTKNGYLPGEIRTKAKNLLCHGIVGDSLPFGDGVTPFSLTMVSKDFTSSFDPGEGYPLLSVFIDCQLRGDQEPSPYFLGSLGSLRGWTEVEVTKIADTAHNQLLLSQVDIYWVAETDPNEF